MSIRIFGASDDLVEIDGHRREEIDVHDKQIGIDIGDDSGGLTVFVEFGLWGWEITTCQIADEVPIPWPVTLRTRTDDDDPDWYPDYSPILEIDCPEGTQVVIDPKHQKYGRSEGDHE